MYSFHTSISGNFDDVIQKVTAELKNQGFGVLTDIDVKATMKAKLGLDYQPYRILGACNPKLANQAITADADIGLLLPCNVVVRQEADNNITVAFMDPMAVLAMAEHPELEAIGKDALDRLQKVKTALAS